MQITVGESIQNNVGMSTRVYAIPYSVLLFFFFFFKYYFGKSFFLVLQSFFPRHHQNQYKHVIALSIHESTCIL